MRYNNQHLVAKYFLTLWDSMDCSLPDSSVHGIFQARILESVAISFSRESSWHRDWTCVSCIGRWVIFCWATREAPRLSTWFDLYVPSILWKSYSYISHFINVKTEVQSSSINLPSVSLIVIGEHESISITICRSMWVSTNGNISLVW